MRRLFVGMAMISMMTLALSAGAGDREIAEQIINQLKSHRASGALTEFNVDMNVNKGVVALKGKISNSSQRDLILGVVKKTSGVKNIVDELVLPVSKSTPASNFVEPRIVATKPAVIEATAQPQREQSQATRTPASPSPEPQMIVDSAPAKAPVVKQAVINPEALLMPQAKPVMKLATAIEPAKKEPASTEPVRQAPAMALPVAKAPTSPQPSTSEAKPLVPAAIQSRTPRAITVPEPVRVPTAQAPQADLNRDRDLNARITKALTYAKQQGDVRGFAMDITTNQGDVWLKGRTIDEEQHQAVLKIVRNVPGVKTVVDDVKVLSAQNTPDQMVRQASGQRKTVVPSPPQELTAVPPKALVDPAPIQSVVQAAPVMQAAPVPSRQIVQAAPVATQRVQPRIVQVPYNHRRMPQPFAPAAINMQAQGAAGMAGQPMPMQAASAGVAYGAPRYDQPQLPNYAWPGYSAYPNYAALSYPKQYSPSAWPFIGPFYPYPQVPLNWRKVTLEWDDGWWFLDYSSKSR